MKHKTTRFPYRLCGILTALIILITGLPRVNVLNVLALGGISEYEIDGLEYYVEWDDEEWGVGLCFFHCEYCSHGFGREFDDGDHESCIADMIGDDIFECGHCEQCAEDYHCEYCGGCFEAGDVPECSMCNSMLCENCHLPEYYCSICEYCCLEEDGIMGLDIGGVNTASLPNCDHVCDTCLCDAENCVICGNILTLGGGAYEVYTEEGLDWCEDHGICGRCMEDVGCLEGYGHCWSCGICSNEATFCDDCGLCEECYTGFAHCEECDYCFGGEVQMCASGGDHCIMCCEDNEWICEQCGECAEGNSKEICPDCGLCEECCLQNSEEEGCTHGYCILSSDYEEHLCTECGYCPDDTECEYCGMCEDCASGYHCEHDICPDNDAEWEEHLCDNCGECFELFNLCEYCHLCEECQEHCPHDLCPEGPEYDDHFFCDECGECFEDDEVCEICELCLDCCRRAALDLGCKHDICVKSDEFRRHYCFSHGQCLSECSHESCKHANTADYWESNAEAHWHTCEDCGGTADSEAHIADEPVIIRVPDQLSGRDGIARISCSVCGMFMYTETIPFTIIPTDGTPYILSQPKDYTGRVSDAQATGPHKTKFSVLAGGSNLTYQWYRWDPVQNKSFQLTNSALVSGVNTSCLTVTISTDACCNQTGYYCEVTNENGSADTRTAMVNARHAFNEHSLRTDLGDGNHARVCVGEGCGQTEDHAEPHRYGDWSVYKVATSNQDGIRRCSCTICGAVQDLPIPAVGNSHTHTFDQLHGNSQNHWLECICGLKKNGSESDHSFTGWAVVSEATEKRAGQKRRYCKECGYTEFESIDKLPHTHDFTTVRKNTEFKMKQVKGGSKNKLTLPPDPYALPNGGFNKDYHYRYCAGCTSVHTEPHTYGPWYIVHSPFKDSGGVLHEGIAGRTCTECGHEVQQSFKGKYPMLTWVYNPDKPCGYGGATINGAVAADPGSTVRLTVDLAESYTFEPGDNDTFGYKNGWSLYEVRSDEGIELDGTWRNYKNYDLNDFKADQFGTATFTMPDGPVALMFMIHSCDHANCGTYTDHVNPSCTGYGGDVLRCSACDVIVKEVTREDPIGHKFYWKKWASSGDCYHQTTALEECDRCGRQRIVNEGYNHKLEKYRHMIEPSCKTPGHGEIDICTLCGEIIDPGPIAPYGDHDWNDWETLIEPTTRTLGMEIRECARCGITDTRKIDFSGPDYRLKAPEKLCFSFEYGEEPEPQTVQIKSIGRNDVTDLLKAAGNTTQYYKVTTDEMTLTVKPNPTGIIIGGKAGEEQTINILTAYPDEDGHLVTVPVTAVSNITFPKGRFHVQLESAKMSVWNNDIKDFETRLRTEADLTAGTVLKITADDPASFRRWIVEHDTSGMVQDWLKTAQMIDEQTAIIAVPPNDITITACDSTLRRLNVTAKLPAVGETIDLDDILFPEAEGYSDVLYCLAQWKTIAEDGTYENMTAVCEEGKCYTLLCAVASNETYGWDIDDAGNLLSEITLNGAAPVKPLMFDDSHTALIAEFAVMPQLAEKTDIIPHSSFSASYPESIGGIPTEFLSAEKLEGPSDLLLTDNGDGTITVTVPENAESGSYVYAVNLCAGETEIVTQIAVTVPVMAKITFDPGLNGFGSMKAETAAIGGKYTLPE